jgi:glucokinase
MSIERPAHLRAHAHPRLLADIGATYARFCIEWVQGRFEHVAVLSCADHPGFTAVVQAYLDSLPDIAPRHGAVAIANPIEGDWVRMTNRDWAFSIQEAQRQLGLSTLLVVNNFTALAMSLPRVGVEGRHQVGGGQAQPNGVIGLIGPGAGLGVSGLVPCGDRWVPLATEGGHASFAPTNEREMRILQHAWKTLPRVSAERLLSGPGLELIHQALIGGAAAKEPRLSAATIVQRALDGSDPVCAETVECFCGMLGTMASDLALTLGATGGIFVGGGIVPRLGALFDRSPFRQRFETKGRFSSYVARMPTYVLTAENPAFLGVSSLLADHVPQDLEGGNPLLERMRAARDALSPAEKRVANFVLDNPRTALNHPIALIAQGAEVSQPTVIRFCRSLGFQGLADFKLKLGSGLTGTLPVQKTQVRREDSTGDLCAKVLDNTISAIMQFRESLNVEAVDRAIELLRQAKRVEFYAMGNSAVVALDAQHKLFRLRMPSVAHTDASMHSLAAELLGPNDVAVFISSSGQPPELARAAGLAIERGAAVVSVTAGQSPLARRSTVCIAVEHGEDAMTFMSMISRILHLLVVDMMSVGLAVRRADAAGDESPGPLAGQSDGEGQVQPAPGVLISHIA